ncbi:peptide deformylase, mitochondrial isoform X1 [Halyomorpha halys]|uniref:peptide deformylase, mitochondrial isoform X1 n=2 Tax=Halyomorpha halys TaxID=286706 RepID=UPI0006D4F94E|nr:peptide deformylase, mitochondrial-like isoform X2 [Halyomorpha halys]
MSLIYYDYQGSTVVNIMLKNLKLRLFKIRYQNWWLGKAPTPPYKHVVQIGDPILRSAAKPVDPSTLKRGPMIKLFNRLYYLMTVTKAAGLAAPQIGVSLRVFAIQCPDVTKFNGSPVLYERRGMEHIPFQIWVNPKMKILEYDRIDDEECCESMRGFSAEIPRFKRILLSGTDQDGIEKSWEAKDWSARIVQHEMDHLDGKFFTDSMNPKSLACVNWDAINHHRGRIYTTYMPDR